MNKPLLTPKQFLEKFIKPPNPNCAMEVRIFNGIRADAEQYLEVMLQNAREEKQQVPVFIAETPAQLGIY